MQHASNNTGLITPIIQLEPFFVARLPLPPSTNHLYIEVPFYNVTHRAKRTRVLAPAARNWKHEALLRLPSVAIVNQATLDRLRLPQRRGVPRPQLSMEVMLYLKDPWRRDLSNCLKLMEDTIFGYLGLDDVSVFDLHPRKAHSDDPHMQVSIRVLVPGGR